jgi:hypothetical protein
MVVCGVVLALRQVKKVVRQVTAAAAEKDRQRRWQEVTVHQDPPMFYLTKHPNL